MVVDFVFLIIFCGFIEEVFFIVDVVCDLFYCMICLLLFVIWVEYVIDDLFQVLIKVGFKGIILFLIGMVDDVLVMIVVSIRVVF